MIVIKRYAVLGAVLLAGCSATPEPPPAAMALPATLAEGEARWPEADWWRGFGNTELTALIAQAEANNTDLAAAAARIDQARAALRVARAPELPALTLSANAMRQGANTSSGAASGNYAYAEAAASWEVDLWGRLRAQARGARASLAASRFDAQALRLSIAAQVARGWLSVLALRERQAIAARDLASARELLAQAEARQSAGEALPGDVAAQRAVVAQVRAQSAALERAQTAALTALALLLGRPAQGFTIGTAGLSGVALPVLPGPGLTADLLARRPDVATAQALLAASGADVQAARAAMLPRITLSASGGGQAGTGPSEALYQLIAGLAQPVFDHGALAGQRDAAVARRAEREAGYRAAVLTALGDVERSLKATGQIAQEVAAGREAADQAELALIQIRRRYETGKEDRVALLDAQRTLFAARDMLAAARADQLGAAVDLFAALGGGWNSPAQG